MQAQLILQECMNELIQNQDNEKFGALTEKLKDLLVSSIVNHTIGELYSSFSIDEKRIEAYENMLGLADSSKYQKVYYYAIMKMTAEIFHEVGTKLANQEKYNVLYHYKYLVPVLELLSQNRMMAHRQLAEHLNISSQSLSNFFRRTNQLDFWQKKKINSNSFYIITAQGKDAYHFYQLNSCAKTSSPNAEHLVVSAFSLLDKELQKPTPDSESIIHMLNMKYGKGQSLFHSLELKMQLNHIIENFKFSEYSARSNVVEHYSNPMIESDEFDDTASIIINGEIAMEGFYD